MKSQLKHDIMVRRKAPARKLIDDGCYHASSPTIIDDDSDGGIEKEKKTRRNCSRKIDTKRPRFKKNSSPYLRININVNVEQPAHSNINTIDGNGHEVHLFSLHGQAEKSSFVQDCTLADANNPFYINVDLEDCGRTTIRSSNSTEGSSENDENAFTVVGNVKWNNVNNGDPYVNETKNILFKDLFVLTKYGLLLSCDISHVKDVIECRLYGRLKCDMLPLYGKDDEQVPNFFSTAKLVYESLKRIMMFFYNQNETSWVKNVLSEVTLDEAQLYKPISHRAVDFVFSTLSRPSGSNDDTLILSPPATGLVSSLRPYQCRAVAWMLEREKFKGNDARDSRRHPLWSRLLDISDREFFFNCFTGGLRTSAPTALPEVLGGLLGDEMGLGKTVETIAAILCHRKSFDNTSTAAILDGEVTAAEQINASNNGDRSEKGGLYTEVTSPVSSQEALWACVCGNIDLPTSDTNVLSVACDGCGIWSHATCVQYENISTRSKSGLVTNNCIGDLNSFLCANCTDREFFPPPDLLRETRATLIIVPETILHQWNSEIDRHVFHGTLRVTTYLGVAVEGLVRPRLLADHDIVLTTYEALRKDLYHCESGGSKRAFLRTRPGQHKAFPTPLTALLWWRVILDEAQMVHLSTTRCAEMALRLATQHRWAVTGTPVQRGPEDLYGMLVFLGVRPFISRHWWSHVVLPSFISNDNSSVKQLLAIGNMLRPVFWRNCKNDVSSELFLPPRYERITSLKFLPVERHFYNKQHEAVSGLARGIFRRIAVQSENGDILKPTELFNSGLAVANVAGSSSTLHGLLQLRQACVHPQVGAVGNMAISKKTLSMLEVLEQLIWKAVLECEDALRIHVCALNGLAALAWIKGNLGEDKGYEEATDYYRRVVRFTTVNEGEKKIGEIRLDDIQALHTFHNLAELLRLRGESIHGRTTRDASLDVDADNISSRYIASASGSLLSANSAFNAITVDEERIKKHFLLKFLPWWYRAIAVTDNGHMRDFIRFVHKELQMSWAYETPSGKGGKSRGISGGSLNSLMHHFQDGDGLVNVLQSQLLSLCEARRRSLDAMRQCSNTPTSSQIDRSGNCPHCRYLNAQDGNIDGSRQGLIALATGRGGFAAANHAAAVHQQQMQGPKCMHCENQGHIDMYESRLFAFRSNNYINAKNAQENHARRQVAKREERTWGDSEVDRILRMINNRLVIRAADMPSDVIEAARDHIIMLDDLKKEYKQLNVVWLAQRERLSKMHEISTARLRLEVVDDATRMMLPDEQRLYRISSSEVPLLRLQNYADMVESQNLYERKKAQVTFLLNERHRMSVEQQNRDVNDTKCHSTVVSGEVCVVCYEALEDMRALFSCGHVVCSLCYGIYLDRAHRMRSHSIKCPTCRADTPLHLITIVTLTRTDENDVVTGISLAPLPTSSSLEWCPFDDDDLGDTEAIAEKFGTKLSAVVRRIRSIVRHTPEAKLLVFSHWKDGLAILQQALSKHDLSVVWPVKPGIKFFRAALHAFRTDPSVCALLLPIQSGGKGLNLVEATHTIFLEPSLSSGLELQAAARMHRMGQTKATYLHRFVISESIEDRILRLQMPECATEKSGDYLTVTQRNACDSIKASENEMMSSGFNLKADSSTLTVQQLKSLFE